MEFDMQGIYLILAPTQRVPGTSGLLLKFLVSTEEQTTQKLKNNAIRGLKKNSRASKLLSLAATWGRRKRREGQLSQHKGQPCGSKQEHSRGWSFRKRGRGAKVLEKALLGCAVTSA